MESIPGSKPVSDRAVKQELESIKQQQAEILERLDNLPQGFIKESGSTFPSAKEGDSLLLWDTRQVFVHDGSDWREL